MNNPNLIDIERFIIPVALIVLALSFGYLFMKVGNKASETIIEPSTTIPESHEYKTPELLKCHNDEGIEIPCTT